MVRGPWEPLSRVATASTASLVDTYGSSVVPPAAAGPEVEAGLRSKRPGSALCQKPGGHYRRPARGLRGLASGRLGWLSGATPVGPPPGLSAQTELLDEGAVAVDI